MFDSLDFSLHFDREDGQKSSESLDRFFSRERLGIVAVFWRFFGGLLIFPIFSKSR
jgi:hypothetical protein